MIRGGNLFNNADPHELAQDLDMMRAWADGVQSDRPPDIVIRDDEGDDYMHRWWVMPRNVFGGVYLHRILRSDKDVPHDHPWDSTSVILEGRYEEQVYSRFGPTLRLERKAGDIVRRSAESAHRIVLTDGPATSLFFMGPRRRQWGFHCPNGWMHWRDFTATGDKYAVGRGCGEN